MEPKLNLVKLENLDQEGKGVQHENQTLKDFNKVNLKSLKRRKNALFVVNQHMLMHNVVQRGEAQFDQIFLWLSLLL